MPNDHVHNWHTATPNGPRDFPGDDSLQAERCSWCGEHREYRDHTHDWHTIESRVLVDVHPPTKVNVEVCNICSQRRSIELPHTR